MKQLHIKYFMLRSTFIHLPRLGRLSERRLWHEGVLTWDDFLSSETISRISREKKYLYDKIITESKKACFKGESEYFTCIPSNEQWRLFEEFNDGACFLDIETNYRNDITVLGISDGIRTWQFIRHVNMQKKSVSELLRQFKIILTFNGASFDIPIIKKYFGDDVMPKVPHIDLRFAGARVGLNGGLKRIERELGIARDKSVQGVSGADALKLWAAYRSTGNRKYLNILLEYNKEDILNLLPLARIIYIKLKEQTLPY